MKAAAVELKTHPLTGVSLIEASAGTGKTYTITHLYVRCLLETGYKVNELLVVTFTNAATQELKGRIRELVYEVSNYLSNPDIQNKVFDELFIQHRSNKKSILDLQEALINFDEAAIYSIHGFCQRVLNIFPVETNSLLQQQIIPDEREIEQSAIRDFWRNHIINLDIAKLEWVFTDWKHPDELLNDVRPLLGFDETVKQTSEQINLQNNDDKLMLSWQQLCILWIDTFEKIQAFLLDSPALSRQKVRLQTVYKLFEALQNYFTETLPYTIPEKWELLTRTKLETCLKKNMQDDGLALAFFEQAEIFQCLHQQWLNNQKIELLISATHSVQKTVTETKLSAQNISFNDLIKQLSDVLTVDNTSLIEKIHKLYPLAMVDEFQDTDDKQYNIFKTLYQTGNNKNKTLLLIGDPKQAIYSFRGADVFTYQQAKQSTPNHYTLETNYRSTTDYINLVNTIFEYNKNAFIFDQLIQFSSSKASTSKQKVITNENEEVTPLACWVYPFSDKPISKGLATDFFANCCADEIFKILQQKTIILDNETVQAKDLTILVKTGRQASLMKNKLAERGISSALILRDSVFASDQAREISLLLEVLIEPSNIKRLCGLLSSDLFDWNARQIVQLQKDNQQLVGLLEQIKSYQANWQQKGILFMFFKLMEDQQTLQKNSRHMDGERRMTNWMHIVELLQQQASRHASFSQALHWLVQQREQALENADNEEHQLRLESDSDLVRIVTIHKSKGLQYPIVFLPFMWDVKSNRYQSKSYSVHDSDGKKKIMILDEAERDSWHHENLAEEIRLFYVAMTRAIYSCYLGWGDIKGAGSSAIAHCLFSDKIKMGKYPQELDVSSAEELCQPFNAMNKQSPKVELLDSVDGLQVNDNFLLSSASKESTKPVKDFDRKIQQQWRISSYSQIATSASIQHDLIDTDLSNNIDRPDYDAVDNLSIEESLIQDDDELNRFTFQKGAKAGNFLHDILEHQSFDQDIDENLILQKTSEYGFEDKWLPCLTKWMDDVLQSDLGTFTLKQLQPSQKLSEMEFYMTSKNLQAEALNTLLHQYDYSQASQIFNFSTINGFLKGFIDLVFEVNGQYFIADYKSNYLGSSADSYDEQSCKQAMYEHHYHLQSLIYTLALHRFLKQRIKNYDYELHFGGVYYLFLRGMSQTGKQQNGIYFDKPALTVIQQLDGLFDNE